MVFARGTGEAPGAGFFGDAFIDALRSKIGTKSMGVYSVNYPASPDFPTAMVGIQYAAKHITQMSATCPQTK